MSGVWISREMEREATARMEEDVQLVARAIRLPLSRALERERLGGVVDALESAFRIGRVYGAYLYDGDGELVSAFGAPALDEDPGRISELAEADDRTGEYGRAGSEEVYSYFVPLTSSGGRSIGLLQVTRRRSDIESYVGALRARVGGILLVGVGVMVGLVLVGHRGAVGRHLDRLLGSMSRVEEGDRTHRADPEGPSEIARLATGLNRMLDSISSAERRVRESREEQFRLETELRRTEKMAVVGRLGAGVAHELGTPLGVLDARAQRLLRRGDLSEGARAEVRAVRGEVSRMTRIVRQLLDLGRGVHGDRRRIPADSLARSVISALRDEAEERDVELTLSGPEPAPLVSVDPAAMERVLLNLTTNAIHAAAGGSVELRWTDGSATTDGRGTSDPTGRMPASEVDADGPSRVGYEVHDDGPGVEPSVSDRIFDPFFTTKPTGEGTGLGLAVVRGIVREHGGSVQVGESELGGAVFRVVLDGTGSDPSVESGGSREREESEESEESGDSGESGGGRA